MQDVIYISYGGENSDTNWYIRLGAFLDFIKTDLMYFTKTSKGESYTLLDFNTDTEINLMYVEDLQASTNPDICVINKPVRVTGTDQDLVFIPENQTADEFISSLFLSDGYHCYGKIMNIYVNMKYILLELENLKEADTGKVVLITFLNTILSSISTALGGVNNLEATIDENTNSVIIRDKNPLPNINYLISKLNTTLPDDKKMSINDVVFDLYGYNDSNDSAGFIKDFSFTTELTPAFSTMISIGATANNTVVGENDTALSRLNWGYTDRFKKEVNYKDSTSGTLVEAIQQSQNTDLTDELQQKISEQTSGKELEKKYFKAYLDYIEYLRKLSFRNNPAYHNTPQYNKDEPQIYSNSLKDFINYSQKLREVQYNYLKYVNPQKYFNSSNPYNLPFAPSTGFIPFNMSLTMDGLSGMKIYNKFLIDTKYLPKNYPSVCEFLIKNIEHKIENNKWTTKLESIIISKGAGIKGAGEVGSSTSSTSGTRTAPQSTSSQGNRNNCAIKDIPTEAKIISKNLISAYLSVRGFSKAARAGIIANLISESGLNLNAFNPAEGGCGAYGLAQWRSNRQTNLYNYAKSINQPIDSIESQIGFLYKEMLTGYFPSVNSAKSSNDPKEVSFLFGSQFEGFRGSNDTNNPEVIKRQNKAMEIFNELRN